MEKAKEISYKTHIDQLTQNVLALLNIWKTLQTGIKVTGQLRSKNHAAWSNRVRGVSRSSQCRSFRVLTMFILKRSAKLNRFVKRLQL
jgi:hypothetical protein